MTSKTAQRKMRAPNPDSKQDEDEGHHQRNTNTTTRQHRTSPISNQEHISTPPPLPTAKMSFLGLGRAQPTSAEKIAAVENELKVMSEMHSR